MGDATALRGVEQATAGSTAAGVLRARRIERRPPLPGGRAVAGGFLVAAAVVGVFASYVRATATPTESYVVAAHALRPGQVIESTDLATARVHLPDDLARHAFRETRSLVGATAVGPIARGEFVQAGAVVRRSARSTSELSFAIEPARAVNGTIRAGELVDVLATYDGGGEAYSSVVAAGATVVAVDGESEGLAPARTITVTLALPPEGVLAVTHAIDVAKVTLVRSADTPPAGSYRSDAVPR